jgi:hypothetical protein
MTMPQCGMRQCQILRNVVTDAYAVADWRFALQR